jgi:hydroxymethylpyrimidine/phosphomethylpyrimidine kinase
MTRTTIGFRLTDGKRLAMIGRVLIIAGSDSSGGAGIQADIKTVTALGGYGATAITALTAQNTQGVFGVRDVDTDFIEQQIQVVLDDVGIDCIKTGMLHSSAVIESVATVLETNAYNKPLVVDPVMFAKGGEPLLEASARKSLMQRLVPKATVLTPNVKEAEVLCEMTIGNVKALQTAGQQLLQQGLTAVLMKGGHLDIDPVIDLLVSLQGVKLFTHRRLQTPHTHGAGCTLASAIATGLAQGLSLDMAVARAFTYLYEAIRSAPGLGKGRGPLNHGYTVRPLSDN